MWRSTNAGRRSGNTERTMQIAFQRYRYREGGVGMRTVISETKGLKISQPSFLKAYKKWLSQQTPLNLEINTSRRKKLTVCLDRKPGEGVEAGRCRAGESAREEKIHS
jgi:hypothetical protein